jgi:hypothetical protein
MNDARLIVRMSKAELDLVKGDADERGMTVSEYVRSVIIAPAKEQPRRPRKPEVSEPLTVARCVCGDLASKHVNGVCYLCKCSRLVIA